MLDEDSIELVNISDGAIISCCGQCPAVHVLGLRVEVSSFDVARLWVGANARADATKARHIKRVCAILLAIFILHLQPR